MRFTHPSTPRRGFTAVEISMVVTVIAILALLILPLFQQQTDEARIAAAEADIREFAVALQLANAQTGFWFSLGTLDNTQNFDAATVDATLDVPVVTWNDSLTAAERSALAGDTTVADDLTSRWQGPYASFRRSITPAELSALGQDYYFRGTFQGTAGGDGLNGPINQNYDSSVGVVNFANDRLPTDPWGTPYLFYGPDYYHLPSGAGGLVTETRFRNSLILSFGPNGLPGDFTGAVDASTLTREAGIVGTGDDIFRVL